MQLPHIEIKTLPESMVEITGEILSADFLTYEDEAVKHVSEHADIDGFRKGTAPKAVIEKKFGDMAILEEMAHRALSDMYPKILDAETIDAIGRPEITITKLARGENVGFKIKTAIVPALSLPDYKKIAQSVEKKEVQAITDKDVDKTIDEIRRMRVHEDLHSQMQKEGKTGHDHPDIDESTLPVVDDEFASKVGPFKTVAELRAMIRENMEREAIATAQDAFRVEVFDSLVEQTTVEVPTILIEIELDKMLARLRSDIEKSGFTMSDYLKQLQKEESDIRKEWEVDAVKRAKMVLIVDAIWKAEHMEFDETIVENEVKNLVALYPEADPIHITEYVRELMRNQKVFSFLEALK